MTMPSGGIVGVAELDIRAVGQHFTTDVQTVVKPGMAGVATEGDKTARSIGKSFGIMWGAVTRNAQNAFAPITEMLGQVQAVSDDLLSKNRAHQAAAIGAAGVGIGAGLQVFASREQTSQAQLRDSISQTGHAYEEYGTRIDSTVKKGEHYGILASQTLDILTTLTTASGNASEAMNRYQLVLDLAARKHMSATAVAQLLASAYAGNTRVLKVLGINVADQTKLVTAATAADKAHTDATTKLKTARQNLKDEEARVAASRKSSVASASSLLSAEASVKSAQASADAARFQHGSASPQYAAAVARVSAAEARLTELRQKGTTQDGLSVSQQIALRKAHDAVASAEKAVTQTAKDQTQAHKDAAGAAHSMSDALDQASKKVMGQADDAANTFTGHLKALGAAVEDDASKFGAKYGPAITATSTGILALGTVMSASQAIIARFRTNNVEAAAAEATVGTAAKTSAAEVESSTAAMATSTSRNMGRVARGVGVAVGAIGAFEVGQHSSSGTSATLGGAISGAVAGLAVGGPLGAAIGGVGGGMIGLLGRLAGEARDTGSAFDVASGDIDGFAKSLAGAYQADKNRLGKQTRQQIDTFLTQHPQAAHVLAESGVTMDQIIAGLRDPNSLKGAVVQAEKAVRAGKITQQEFGELYRLIGDINTQWSDQIDTVDDIASINGQVTQHMRDERKSLKALLDGIYGVAPLPNKETTPKGLGGLLGNAIPGRAGGGPTFAGSSYIVGEHGPELLVMGGSDGYVHPDIKGGDGSALVAEMRAMRMDMLQLVHAARATTRATEDVPDGVARAVRRHGDGKFSSPSLATL